MGRIEVVVVGTMLRLLVGIDDGISQRLDPEKRRLFAVDK